MIAFFNDLLIMWELRTLSSNNCVTVSPYCVAGTYIPYVNFYFYKLYLNRTTLDVTGVDKLPVW
jgi:hypothetical protein